MIITDPTPAARPCPDLPSARHCDQLDGRGPTAGRADAACGGVAISQLCTEAQVCEPDYGRLCKMLDLPPIAHRKHWEFADTLAVLEPAGPIMPGYRALGFGVGTERLPSYLASRGVTVVATDAPPEAIVGHGWEDTNQHAQQLSQLFFGNLISSHVFERLVSYRAVDMNAIPDDLRGFDVCWSSCCFEHLGTLRKGLDFVINALDTLKPGGIAVHTTEFNLSSNENTIEEPRLRVYRKCDIEAFISDLMSAGHEVWPLNLHPGFGKLDEYTDPPPYVSEPHLKLQINQLICTSFGLVIRKKR